MALLSVLLYHRILIAILTDPDVGAMSLSSSLPTREDEAERGGEDLDDALLTAAAFVGPTSFPLERAALGVSLLEASAEAVAAASASAVARCRLRIAWNSSKVRDTMMVRMTVSCRRCCLFQASAMDNLHTGGCSVLMYLLVGDRIYTHALLVLLVSVHGYGPPDAALHSTLRCCCWCTS